MLRCGTLRRGLFNECYLLNGKVVEKTKNIFKKIKEK